MLKSCIILNGPPGCGKDTVGLELTKYGYQTMAFKEQLYIETAKLFDLPLVELIALQNDRTLKDEPYDDLIHPEAGACISPREALIYTSEKYIKPKYGKDYFGKAAADSCVVRNIQFAVFTDGGFGPEVDCLEDIYEWVTVIRLHRQGCTFAGDSRNYMPDAKNVFDVSTIEGEPRLTAAYIVGLVFHNVAAGDLQHDSRPGAIAQGGESVATATISSEG